MEALDHRIGVVGLHDAVDGATGSVGRPVGEDGH
jgi:hypothetical protein